MFSHRNPPAVSRGRKALIGVILLWTAGCRPAAPALPPVETPPPGSTPAAATATAPTPVETLPAQAATTAPTLPAPFPTPESTLPPNLYRSQPGDTLAVIAARFGLFPLDFRCLDFDPHYCPAGEPGEVAASEFDAHRLLPIDTLLVVPEATAHTSPAVRLIPDSELVFSAAASDFDTAAFLQEAGGFLATHNQYLMMNAWNTAAGIVDLVAEENSVNPRLLLALLEYQCSCVTGMVTDPEPYLGADFTQRFDLYGQLVWGIFELSNGYYGWRSGVVTEVVLRDGSVQALDPHLNAGTAGLYQFFAALYGRADFEAALDPASGFPATYRRLFGDPWQYERPTIPDGAAQPVLDLPFEPGLTWSLTGGPHPAFEGNGPRAALDFAPASAEPGCQPTPAWVTAMAPGLVVRSEYGLLVQDLDGDGDENTGWALMYLHVAESGRAQVGDYLFTGDRLGQPSCEGGRTNGTHVHIARKLNGEWIPAGSGPFPFDLDGWIAADGETAYKGSLSRGGEVLLACECSWRSSWIENE